MLAKKSLKTKLVAAFSVVAVNLLAVGGISHYYMTDMAAKYGHIANVNFVNTNLLGSMRGTVKDIHLKTYVAGLTNEPKVLVTLEQEVKDLTAEYERLDKAYNEIPFVEGELQLYQAQRAVWDELKKAVPRMQELRRASDQATYSKVASNEFRDLALKYYREVNVLVKFHEGESKKWLKAASDAQSRGSLASLIVVAAGFILAQAIGMIFSNSLSRRLKELADKLSDGANTVSSASEQVSSAGTELSASATEQAAALQETVASIEQVSAMVAKNAENAKRSHEVSTTSQEVATRGKQTVIEMIQAINDISQSNNEIMKQIDASNQEISEIVKIITEIGDKTKVINDIVFQTKLLSFNASVEAARAGEHGKGFAVVAEEVGNLAQMSGNAAKEISEMLENSIRKVESTVTQTKSKVETLVQGGKEKVEAGSLTAKRCGEVLDEIVTNVSRVGELVSEIATASTEQAQGVAEINKAMSQMDQVTQQNAAASEQSAGAAEALTQEAGTLRSIVQTLVATVEGGEGASQAPVSAKTDSPRKGDRSGGGKVVELKKGKKKPASEQPLRDVAGHSPLKKAAGAEYVPSQSDPRFEDV